MADPKSFQKDDFAFVYLRPVRVRIHRSQTGSHKICGKCHQYIYPGALYGKGAKPGEIFCTACCEREPA